VNPPIFNESEWFDGVNSSFRKALIYTGASDQPALLSSAIAGAPDNTAAPLDSQFHIWASIFDGSSSAINFDGVSQSLTPSSPGAVNFAGLTIGSRHALFSGNTLTVDADMAELIVVAGSLSTTDFNAIGTYFEAKYGLDTAFPDPPVVPLAPEPATWLLFGAVFALMAGWQWRRSRR
jgi:hypothetical protein